MTFRPDEGVPDAGNGVSNAIVLVRPIEELDRFVGIELPETEIGKRFGMSKMSSHRRNGLIEHAGPE